jgi:amino acid adenylation domain-containing protein
MFRSDSVREKLAKLSPEKRLLLEKRISGKSIPEKSSEIILPRSETGPVPLSFAQQRLWFLDQLEENRTVYNEVGGLNITGPLKVTVLEQCLTEIIRRHEILRTTFPTKDEVPIQDIAPPQAVTIKPFYLQALPEKEAWEELQRLTIEEKQKPFDLVKGPLLRINLLRLPDVRTEQGIQVPNYIFLLTVHHIIYDGWSMEVLTHELSNLYEAFSYGRPSPLPSLPIQYADFASWQRKWLGGKVLEQQAAYWKQQLAGSPTLLDLPTDYPRPSIQRFQGASLEFNLSSEITNQLKQLSQQTETSLFMALFSAFAILLSRYSGQRDIVVGSPVANRTQSQVEHLIGFFVNTLVLRLNLKGNPTFEEVLKQTRQMVLGAYAHQDIPFEQLVEELQPERDLSQSPLFQVLFILQNPPIVNLELSGLRVELLKQESVVAKFDLSLFIFETTQDLTAVFEYNTDLFEQATIERMAGHLQTLISGLVANPKLPIHELPLLTEVELQQRQLWNETAADYPYDKTIGDLFEEQAEQTPDHVAVVFEERKLTYKELNDKANQVAHYLRDQYRIKSDDLVGVMLDRSEEMIVALLGVLKSGGAYVPIDPEYPEERIKFILEDSGCEALITEGKYIKTFEKKKDYPASFYIDINTVPQGSTGNQKHRAFPHHLAYVIYTSGSTGKPKGVMVTHRNIVSFHLNLKKTFCLQSSDTILGLTTICFDISMLELICSLLSGMKVVITPDNISSVPEELVKVVTNNRVSALQITPSRLKLVIESVGIESLLSVRVLLIGGEELPQHLFEQLKPLVSTDIYNVYGPTETTVWSCSKKLNDGTLTIGTPLLNEEIYILSEDLTLQPTGVKGEICIGGTGVSRGYWQDPVMTTEKFVPHPFRRGERLYKTGDLGRLLPDGDIEFLGRKDDQVKVRGYRIECGEVEQTLLKHPDIKQAVVVAVPIKEEMTELAAYLVCGEEITASELRDHVSRFLPEYMIPSWFIPLEQVPLTPNGKIDRKALPAPDGMEVSTGIEYVAPRDELERQLAAVWEDVLGREGIGIQDNFFEIGGHSLKATQVVSRFHKLSDKELRLREIFQYPTIASLSEIVREKRETVYQSILPVAEQVHYPLSHAQKRLWVLHHMEECPIAYNMPGAFMLEGKLDKQAFQNSFEELIQRHEILRTSFITVEGEPRQKILSEVEFRIEEIDLRIDKETIPENGLLKQHAEQEAQTPFDLGKAPLLRVKLLHISETRYLLLFTIHHIIADGWSLDVLAGELSSLYKSHAFNEHNLLETLPLQYKDYTAWHNELLESEGIRADREYWRNKLSGEIPVLDIPTDYTRPPVQTYQGSIHLFQISEALTEGLNALNSRYGVSLFMSIMALVKVLLYRYTGQEDIVVGAPIAGRQHKELDGQIGFYVNTLVLRDSISREDSFAEVLDKIKRTAMEAYDHQIYPFDRLVEELDLRRDLSRSPLFDVLLVLQNKQETQFELPGVTISPFEYSTTISKFDLTWYFTETENVIQVGIEYNTALFKDARIERMSAHFLKLLKGIVSDANRKVQEVSLLSEYETSQVLNLFNNTWTEYPGEETVVDLFEEQAALVPEKVAVVFEERKLTYKELNKQANQVAHYLRNECEIRPDDLVGVMLDRSEEMVVALLGILKSGAAYMPIDPDYPRERLAFMIIDSGIRILITQPELRTRLLSIVPGTGVPSYGAGNHELTVVNIETVLTSHYPIVNLQSSLVNPQDLAYVIYTSGSTGKPKGVLGTHQCLQNLMQWQLRESGIEGELKTLQFAALSFDVSIQEILFSLISRGELHIVGSELRYDMVRLADYVKENSIQLITLPFSALHIFFDESSKEDIPYEKLGSIRHIITSGEQLQITKGIYLFLKQQPDVKLHNQYGPSETHVVTSYTIDERLSESDSLPPIGSPVSNTQIYILDQKQQPVPIGITGELYIGGANVARGYLNNRDLTHEKFIPDTFREGDRLYRTGDLARWSPDGNIEFLGRRDDQVKIRGFRIECGEVEQNLLQHPSIDEAVVVARENEAGDKGLVSYLVSNEKISLPEIRKHLSLKVPDYMIPSYFVELEELPLTPSGKIDRKALPELDDEALDSSAFTSARTPTEEVISSIWSTVLKREHLGIHDNFFELGGHSLKATQVISRIHDFFHIDLTVRVMFEAPTIAELARQVDKTVINNRSNIPPLAKASREGELPLSFAQSRIWFLDRMEGSSVEYNMPEALRLKGNLDIESLERTIYEIVRRHESLRTHFEEIDGRPVQVIKDEVNIKIPIIDLTGMKEKEREHEVKQIIRDEANKAFDLGKGSVLRVRIIKLTDNEHILLRTFHHIVSDGWSMGVFLREFATLYETFTKGGKPSLPELIIQYADFAIWQRSWLDDSTIDSGLEYWRNQLKGAPPLLELPITNPRPAIQTFDAGHYASKLEPQLIYQLRKLSGKNGCTLFMTLLSAFSVLLYRYSGCKDIVVGSPIANRQRPELEELIGFFVNSIVMRTDLSGNPAFMELLSRVRQTTLDAYAHQDIPFEKIVEELEPERNMSYTPLYQIVFALQNAPMGKQELSDIEITPIIPDDIRVRFDLEVHCFEDGDDIHSVFIYNKDLFDETAIECMSHHFTTLLEGIVKQPETEISRLPILTPQEKNQLLFKWNQTGCKYPKEKTVVDLFEEQAETVPDNIALVYQDEKLTYRELNRKANQLAHYLMKQGVKPEKLTGLCIERSTLMIIGILGILKAGGGYVPLDPDYPRERLNYMIDDSDLDIVLSTENIKDKLPESIQTVILLDRDWDQADRECTENSDRQSGTDNLAYVIYTSGSTGVPKGVLVEHGNLFHSTWVRKEYYRSTGLETFLLLSPVSFDSSVPGIFWSLTQGVMLVLPEQQLDVGVLIRLMAEHRVTHLISVPALYSALLSLPDSFDLTNLRVAIIAGESGSRNLLSQHYAKLPNTRLFNEYGPTEGTVWCSVHCFKNPHDNLACIGSPIANTKIYILDVDLNNTPPGIPGELCIEGAGLARGYRNRPDLTAERFIPNPFNNTPGSRLYKTGDLCRYLSDGSIEFIGRIDNQVKLRGYRIELGEIESVLASHPDVQHSAVIMCEDRAHDKKLAAYVVVGAESGTMQSEFREKSLSNHVSHWRELYENIHTQPTSDEQDDFNIKGWNSSYTGEPIPAEEMREWVDQTVSRIQALSPDRVLEIGCGTGLLLLRIAPHCTTYTGTDFSDTALSSLENYIKKRRDLSHVTLYNKSAEETGFLEDNNIDTVILNSVAQYFPGMDYLFKVIEALVKTVKRGGAIFLGDLRCLPLFETFHTSVLLHKAENDMSLDELRLLIKQSMLEEKELVIHPEFFTMLKEHLPAIGRVDIAPKRGDYCNELSLFRYDVTLHIGPKQQMDEDIEWVVWNDSLDLKNKLRSYDKSLEKTIGFRGVRDDRIAKYVYAVELLHDAQCDLKNVGEFRDHIAQKFATETIRITPETIYTLAGKYLVNWMDIDATGSYNIIISGKWNVTDTFVKDAHENEDFPLQVRVHSYGNNPLKTQENREQIKSLRGYLAERIPDYMLPATITILDEMPLTPSGKIDRNGLPDPDQTGIISGAEYRAPCNRIEEELVTIWGELLGKERIGIDDNFFELGGHSLKAVRVISKIHYELGVEVNLRNLFLYPTISGLADVIAGMEKSVYTPIAPIPEAEHYPLSHSQKRLWTLDKFEKDSIAYNAPAALMIEGDLNLESLQGSFGSLIERHEILRTRFITVNGEPRQKIEKANSFHIDIADMSDSPNGDKDAKIAAYEYAHAPFNLEKGKLIRVKAIKLKDNRCMILLNMHHIICDGWSIPIFVRELMAFYESNLHGRDAILPALSIQFKDYTVWHNEQLESDSLKGAGDYWHRKLSGEIPVLDLPADFPRPAVQSFEGDRVNFTIIREDTSFLKRLAGSHGVSLFMSLVAMVKVLLYRYTCQNDIIVGTPMAGRQHKDLEGQIGFYVNTLALMDDVKGEEPFSMLLKKVKETVTAGFDNQIYPFDLLVEELEVRRDMSRSPLFDVMVTMQNSEEEEFHLSGVTISPVEIDYHISKFDVTFSFIEIGEEIFCSIEYNTALYKEDRIKRTVSHFKTLFHSVISNPEIRVDSMNILPEEERHKLIYEFNESEAEYTKEKTISALFEEQVARTPDNIAVEFEEKELTYKELNEQANQVAHYLREQYQIKPDDLVGVMMDRSEEMIVALLGIMKSGGAYVPLDPEYPEERIRYMLEDSGCKVLITQSELQTRLLSIVPSTSVPSYGAGNHELIIVTIETLLTSNSPIVNSQSSIVNLQDLAYVIYTSGSTGRPKGVMIEQRGFINMIFDQQSGFNITSSSRVLQLASPSFDVSLHEMFTALLCGGTLVLINKDKITTPMSFLNYVEEKRVSIASMSPAFLKTLEHHPLPTIHTLVTGGEPPSKEEVSFYHKTKQYINAYGPTETSVCAAYYRVTSDTNYRGDLPIGKPVSNISIYILNESLPPVPIGVFGEICISGVGLARGYVNNPVSTAEKFIAHPFKKDERLYRTGDLGRWLPDGNIEFFGRKDDQVKIRGYRIECGEIEQTLLQHPEVEQAVVVARIIPGETQELVGYLISREELTVSELRLHAGRFLPEYMIPSWFVRLERFPLTSSGKIDRKALPVPEGMGLETGVEYVAPRDEIERQLATIWEEVLGREKVGIHDNFFEIGGHSLKATRIVSRYHSVSDIELWLRDIFQYPTIAALAEVSKSKLKTGYQSITLIKEQSHYPLSHAQKRLWVLHHMEESPIAYNMPSALMLEGDFNHRAFQKALEDLIDRHEILRTSFITIEGEPRQKIRKEAGFRIEEIDLRENHNIMSNAESLQKYAENEARTPFNLEKDHLLRVKLLRVSETTYLLLFTMHHIIGDGWSIGVLVRELVDRYEGYCQGREISLEPLRIQYKDYAAWQNRQIESDAVEVHRTYWHEKLSGEIPTLDTPTDYARPPVQTFKGASHHFQINETISEELKTLNSRYGVSLFMTLTALVKVLLYRYTEQEDIIVGTPVAGRQHRDLETQIGFYINTLVLRDTIRGENSFGEVLEKIKRTSTEAYDHQIYPFDRLVEELDLRRDLSHSPIFDVMVILQNNEDAEFDLPGVRITPFEAETTISKFDLTFNFMETENGIQGGIEYNSDLFKSDRIERMAVHFQELLKGVLSDTDQEIQAVNILSEHEKRQLLGIFNDKQSVYPGEKTIVDLFEEQVKRTPHNVAIVFENKKLTYHELNEQSNQLAHYLKENYQIQPDDLIGVMVGRSEKMIITILGILKSGGAYVPIDPEYPEERIRFILEDSDCKALITQSELKTRLLSIVSSTGVPSYGTGNHELTVVTIETVLTSHSPIDNLQSTIVNPHHLAYVMYTSGSTGRPKGVMVTHDNIVSFHLNIKKSFSLQPSDTILGLTTICFDISVLELVCSLLSGMKLIIASDNVCQEPDEIIRVINEYNISVLQVTPSRLGLLMEAGGTDALGGLNTLLIGGEELPENIFQKLKPLGTVNIYNVYGPTETTIWSCGKMLNDGVLTIGTPLLNEEVYILSKGMINTPIGVAGEIFIGGTGLARGYISTPELTAEKFIPHPFDRESRLYRTGDLGRWLTDGNIEFLGRKDDQVKIRGYRIECGEIEQIMLQHSSIREVVVSARKMTGGTMELVGYIICSEEVKIPEIRSYLGTYLPEYMIPSYFVRIDHMPLTQNGKIDRKALPVPEGLEISTGKEYVPPRDEMERELVTIWEEVLGRQNIGIEDNFFELGGHSLKALKLVSKIQKIYDVDISLMSVFQAPVIKDLVLKVVAAKNLDEHGVDNPYIVFNEKAKKRLFCFPPAAGYSIGYRELAIILDTYAFYGFHFIEHDDPLSEYLKLITQIQSTGPYILLGYSAGGNLAFEVARELKKHGRIVSDVIMLDSYRREEKQLLSPEEQQSQRGIYLDNEVVKKYMINERLKETFIRKMEAYTCYLSNSIDHGMVHANIHVINAADKEKLEANHAWSNATDMKCTYFQGVGKHEQMLDGEFIKTNAGIISGILKEISFHST